MAKLYSLKYDLAVMDWQNHPSILEIQTYPWLYQLSQNKGRQITLNNIPEDILLEKIRSFDVLWLMGIWERSPKSIKIAREHKGLQKEFKETLRNYSEDDVVGSPYAIKSYQVDPALGDSEGLKRVSNILHKNEKKIIVDFVPNHTAIDCEWVEEHPNFYFHPNNFTKSQAKTDERFFILNEKVFAHGKDPYFSPWTDTLQLNSFSKDYREKTVNILNELGGIVDGVRCDMAMLLTTRIFEKTWAEFLPKNYGQGMDNSEYWEAIIPKVKAERPNFKFIAEVYWNMEWELQQQGFDFCYDKKLYDRLIHARPVDIRGHLKGDIQYQKKLLRFIENHDEPRAIKTLKKKQSLAAFMIISTTPGAFMAHQGQLNGRSVKHPIQLRRFANESSEVELYENYLGVLKYIQKLPMNGGKWINLESNILDENKKECPLISFAWYKKEKKEITLYLIVVNYSNDRHTDHIDIYGILEHDFRETHLFAEDLFDERSFVFPTEEVREKEKMEIPINLESWEFSIYKLTQGTLSSK